MANDIHTEAAKHLTALAEDPIQPIGGLYGGLYGTLASRALVNRLDGSRREHDIRNAALAAYAAALDLPYSEDSQDDDDWWEALEVRECDLDDAAIRAALRAAAERVAA